MSQVVLIAGMHRSGTSMIARILNLCGVYLGPENDLYPPTSDNLDGYWENRQFVLLNDELFTELSGGWDYPPKVDSGWEKLGKFSHIRSKASELIQQFSDHEQWGWKDPRNSLTFPFWRELIPSMKVVICVRNPLEVAHSLLKRNYFSPALAFNLWFEYNQRILIYSEPENRIITHYDSYFHDPNSELTRILKFLELDVSERRFKESIDTVNLRLRHNQSTLLDLMSEAPSKVIDLYQKMCNQSGDILQSSLDINSKTQTPFDENLQSVDIAEKNVSRLSMELIIAKENILEKEQNTQVLRAQLDAREKELSDIYRSKAWYFTQMARRIRQKLFG